ncbi:hypothetical protein Tco_0353581 [Tanacetum coccineum]
MTLHDYNIYVSDLIFSGGGGNDEGSAAANSVMHASADGDRGVGGVEADSSVSNASVSLAERTSKSIVMNGNRNSYPGKNSTHMSNSFDTLSNFMEEGRNDPQSKVDGNMQTGGKESSEAHVETIGLSSKVTNESGSPVSKNDKGPSTYPKPATWECINESDTDDDNVFTSFMGHH